MDENTLLNLALEVGEIMLTSGAETNRVEDTIERILSIDFNHTPEAFVTTTGLFVSINGKIEGSHTKLKRISNRSVNLEKLSLANSLSRNLVSRKISVEEAFEELERIKSLPERPAIITLFCYAIVSCMFTFMMGGTISDSIASFFIGFLTGASVIILSKHKVSTFLTSIFGGAIIAFMAVMIYHYSFGDSYSKIIIGSLMPLVPGVAITNAIRDIMAGDFLSGTARVVEAVLIAVAIASGAGPVLRIATIMLGGI